MYFQDCSHLYAFLGDVLNQHYVKKFLLFTLGGRISVCKGRSSVCKLNSTPWCFMSCTKPDLSPSALVRHSWERIPCIPIASQEEALSTGKARGTPGSDPHPSAQTPIPGHRLPSQGTDPIPAHSPTFQHRDPFSAQPKDSVQLRPGASSSICVAVLWAPPTLKARWAPPLLCISIDLEVGGLAAHRQLAEPTHACHAPRAPEMFMEDWNPLWAPHLHQEKSQFFFSS